MKTEYKATEIIAKLKKHSELMEKQRFECRVAYHYHKWLNAKYVVALYKEHGIKTDDFDHCEKNIGVFERLFNHIKSKHSNTLTYS